MFMKLTHFGYLCKIYKNFRSVYMFHHGYINQLPVKNRLSVAPMTRISATEDGEATQIMHDYYQQYIEGGFGLIITEGLYTDELFSQGYKYQPGLVSSDQALSWSKIIESAQSKQVKVIAQLMHAGALSQYDSNLSNVAPSNLKPKGEQLTFYYGEGDYGLPRELAISEINQIVSSFAHAAKRAQEAGFNGVEIHSANGYLLDQFLTAETNKRLDAYGGNVENRLRLHGEIVDAIREVTSENFVIGIRLSQAKVNDAGHKWHNLEEARNIFTSIEALDVDYLHLTEPNILAPAWSGVDSLMSIAQQYFSRTLIVNGGLSDKALIEQAIKTGADLVAIGTAALSNPDLPMKHANNEELVEFSFDLLSPIANLENQYKKQARVLGNK